MASKININDFLTYKANKDKAYQYMHNNFNSFSQADKDTWKNNSQFNTPIKQNDPEGFFAFLDYFAAAFGSTTNSNSSFFATTSLAAGSGNSYTSRASRLPWIAT